MRLDIENEFPEFKTFSKESKSMFNSNVGKFVSSEIRNILPPCEKKVFPVKNKIKKAKKENMLAERDFEESFNYIFQDDEDVIT